MNHATHPSAILLCTALSLLPATHLVSISTFSVQTPFHAHTPPANWPPLPPSHARSPRHWPSWRGVQPPVWTGKKERKRGANTWPPFSVLSFLGGAWGWCILGCVRRMTGQHTHTHTHPAALRLASSQPSRTSKQGVVGLAFVLWDFCIRSTYLHCTLDSISSVGREFYSIVQVL